MQKQQSIIISLGVILSLLFSSHFDVDEGTVNIKLTITNMTWIMIAILFVLGQKLFQRQKIPCKPQNEEMSIQAQIDSPIRVIQNLEINEYSQTKESSSENQNEEPQLQYTQSQKDCDTISQTSSFRKRSCSIASEGGQRKVSFDESQNTIHTYKKNNRLELRNYKTSFQQLKQEKKKKNELVKQKRKEENFKKLNINDINKKARKRKSSLEESLSQTSY